MDQPKFSLSDFLPYQLAVLSERVSKRLTVEYQASHGLSVADWRVLVHLQGNGEISVRDITERVNLGKPRVSRAVSKLEGLGFVKKQSSGGDGRLVSIALTAQGEAALGEILPVAGAIEAELLGALSAGERRALVEIMERLHVVLDGDVKAVPRSSSARAKTFSK